MRAPLIWTNTSTRGIRHLSLTAAIYRSQSHWRVPVGERHEVLVGCAGGVKVVGSFLELLAQVEDLLFELADAGAECLGVVGAPDSAGAEDFLTEDF